MSEWQNYKLSDFMDFNPITPFKKNAEGKKISMENLGMNTKKINTWEISKYNGGTKFINGDTLVARITPCLENGKMGYVDFLGDGEIAFGSTEFIVLRKKEGVSDSQFIFYFAFWNEFRDLAVQLMTGTSGRQRVETDVLKQKVFALPSLPTQRAIAEVLSSLDDKIDLLTRQNATLEALAQTYFRQWFDKCEPLTPLGEIFSFVNGFAFKGSTYELEGEYRIITIKNVQDGEIDPKGAAFIKEIPKGMNEKCKLSIGDVLISLTGNVGRVGIVVDNNLLLNQRVAKFQPNDNKLLPYFYFMFRQNDMKIYLESIAKGTAQQNLSPVETLKTLIAFDEELVYGYIKIADPLFNKIIANRCQTLTLQKLRDTLLPKLISGEVRVK